MVLCIMKYSELNFPVLSVFGKIHNYTIIHNVIHFGYLEKRSLLHSKIFNMLVKWDDACFVAFLKRILLDDSILPLLNFFFQNTDIFRVSEKVQTKEIL